MRLRISKLALQTPTSKVYRNALLKSAAWTEDLKYLHELYIDMCVMQDEVKADSERYELVKPKLQELLADLHSIEAPYTPQNQQALSQADHDVTLAAQHAAKGDFTVAYLHQTHALNKVHRVMEGLAKVASTAPRDRVASFIDKTAYGYDISGEVFEGSGETANRENEKNLNDTGTPDRHHETAPNPANLTRDTDADAEFPELAEQKNKRIVWPPRIR